MIANEDSNPSDFPDSRSGLWSDLVVCEAYLNLFTHCSWIMERKEYITYIGDGSYSVKSQITLNCMRLLEDEFCIIFNSPDGLTKKAGFIPVFEHAKQPISLELTARHSNGKAAIIAPNEVCWGLEVMIILGTVERARKLGYKKFDKTEPTHHLARALHKELSRGAPREESDEFLSGFRDSLSKCGLLEEYNFYAENCPGFEFLFFHFLNNRVVFLWVDLEPDGSPYDVIFLDCIEYHFQMNSLSKQFRLSGPRKTKPEDKREGVFRKLKQDYLESRKYKFTYPLRRIGTSELEQFVFAAPEWTMFHPESEDKSGYQYCSIMDHCERYNSGQENLNETRRDIANEDIKSTVQGRESSEVLNSSIFHASGLLTQESLSVRTYSKFPDGEGKKGPRRRFSVFDENENLPSPDEEVHWGEFSTHNMHNYVLRVGWQARPGKRGRANLVFLGLSAVFITLTCLYVCCGVGKGFWNEPTLVPTFTFVVTLFALLYSNLQEEVPYYRHKLMSFPRYAIRLVTVFDIFAFLMGLLFGSIDSGLIGSFKDFGSAGMFLITLTQKTNTAPTLIIAIMIAVWIIAVCAFYLMWLWMRYNRERDGKNTKWFHNRVDNQPQYSFKIAFIPQPKIPNDQQDN